MRSYESRRAHGNGDLTIQGAAGRIRLVNGSDAWKRYNNYLEGRNIDPQVEET